MTKNEFRKSLNFLPLIALAATVVMSETSFASCGSDNQEGTYGYEESRSCSYYGRCGENGEYQYCNGTQTRRIVVYQCRTSDGSNYSNEEADSWSDCQR